MNLVKFSRRQERLLEIVQELITHHDEAIIFEKLAIEIKTLFECSGVRIYKLDATGERLNPVFCDEPPHTEKILKTTLLVDQCLTGRAIRSKRGLIFNDANQAPGVFQIPGIPVDQNDHLMVIPMLNRHQQPTGVIALLRLDSKFDENELTSGNILGIYLSTILSNAQNYHALKIEAKAREESELRFRTLVKFAPVGIISIDTEGNILQVNPKLLEILGSPSAEATMAINMFNFPLLVKAGVSEDFKKVIKDGKPLENEIEYTSKWGKTVYIRYVVAPNFDEAGVAVGAIGSFEDITDRKQAETTLKASEEKFRKTFMTSPDSVNINRLEDGMYVSINPSFTKIVGYTEADILGKTSIEMNIWANTEDRAQLVAGLKEHGEVQNLEVRFRTKSGKILYGLMSASIIELNGTAHILSITRDITERKLIGEKLQQSEQRYAMLFNVMDEGVAINECIRDEKGEVIDYKILEVNPAFTKNSAYSREQVEGKLATELYQMSTEFIQEWWKDHAEMRQAVESEMYFEPLDRWFHITTTPPVGDRFATFSEDITEKKQAEKEKEELRARFLQAQKMESVGRLAGGVAHDFNNMLSVILGHTELSLEKLAPQHPLYMSLQEIRKAGERSAEITRQLLAFARKQVIQPKILDLDQTVKNMLSLLRRLIGEDIELYWHPSHESKSVKMDPSQIDQIMANLIVNARDAMPGTGKLTIETRVVTFDQRYCDEHEEARPGEFVLLAISDDGKGMDQEILDKIFEPFFTTKGLGQGTGLGLSTVFGIVKQNEGFLNVYSEVGAGTTFKIYLPRHTVEPVRASDRVHEPILKGQSELILVVEDEVAIMEMARETLEGLGYNVLGAISPKQALELAHEHVDNIKLLLTDVVMPEMNGRDLASQIQEIIPNIKILFMSGYTSDVISHRGILEADMNFIQKPFARKDLASQLRMILNTD